MFTRFSPLACLALAALWSGGCASVTVRDAELARQQPVAKPKVIYVQPFETARAKVKQNPMRKHKGQLPQEAQQLLAKHLASEFEKLGFRAVVGPGGPAGWVVSGRFTRLEEGSRLLRMGLGLGFGGTKMETDVAVSNLPARAPFLRFKTTGGSGATPGAATNPIPFSAAPTALLNSKEGVSDDAARTARQIVRRTATYMVERGWLAPGSVPAPKTTNYTPQL